ncbi:hypothetical protein CY35_01G199300 [Sphagnum magellanicum]|nr:hypothetical protein CY35_01G199300 [Sphagnum magellanicum]KAH9577150.1 hypothetical protein CY35_01G199300 [Sphagnum magellanicum]KAH9577151.1 hypothetical protein CY35_01G199300 [Sphagnum magellanicum]
MAILTPFAEMLTKSCVQLIWTLLPSVCNNPTDTAQGFGLIAQSTQTRCTEGKEPELRVLICSSLQVFCLMHTFMCCNSTVPQDCRNLSHSCALIFLKLCTSTSDVKAYKLSLCRSICALR